MMIRVGTDEGRGAKASLWTPWGIQRRSERDAQALAIRKLVSRVEELRQRRNLELITEQPDSRKRHA